MPSIEMPGLSHYEKQSLNILISINLLYMVRLYVVAIIKMTRHHLHQPLILIWTIARFAPSFADHHPVVKIDVCVCLFDVLLFIYRQFKFLNQ
jgi:hypothetical protein